MCVEVRYLCRRYTHSFRELAQPGARERSHCAFLPFSSDQLVRFSQRLYVLVVIKTLTLRFVLPPAKTQPAQLSSHTGVRMR